MMRGIAFLSVWVALTVFHAVADCAVSPYFAKAVPVWPAGRAETMNDTVRFRGSFIPPIGMPCILSLTGSTCYRVRLNGEFVAFGPARGPKGAFRVDCLDLSGRAKEGENLLEIDVQGANVNSFEYCEFPSFLQAELSVGGRTLLATSAAGDGFAAFDTHERVRRVPRFDYQRLFAEAYRIGGGSEERLSLEERPRVKLLPRRVPQPDYSIDSSFRKVKVRRLRNDPHVKTVVGREITLVGKNGYKGYKPEEFIVDVKGEIQRYVDDPDGSIATTLWRGGKVTAGFLGLEVRVVSPCRLVAFMSEMERTSFSGIDNDGGYAVFWDIAEPGDYTLEAFDPNAAMFVETFADGGEAEVAQVWMREFKSPLPYKRRFSGVDPELKVIYDAAAETLAQNSVDVFTDCPDRERAAWIGDTFFTARASYLLAGTTLVEDVFLENYALAPKFDGIPDGALPMVYPGEHPNGEFIPNFGMWLVMQTAEYAKRGGNPRTVAALTPKLVSFARYLEAFLNADGLLENLPGWVFLEWSEMAAHTKGVNYPSNMQYAGMLDALSALCGDAAYARRAAEVRRLVREKSWNGRWFRDCDLDDGCTEGCQYYAFFFGVADFDRDRELWNRLVTSCGPSRDAAKIHPELPASNSIFGYYMRFDMLLRTGRRDVLEREAKAYFLPMARATGTIWENKNASGSNSHGLSSIAAAFVDPPAVAYERTYIWPEGRMPFVQPHQVAAKTEETASLSFDPADFRRPYIDWYKPAPSRNTDLCVITVSGGAFDVCCDHERMRPAVEWLLNAGITVADVTYRTPRPAGLPVHQSAWADLQRAVRIVRSEADRRGFDPQKIGATGISAGAKAVLLVATSSLTPAYEPVDEIDSIPCNLAFAIPQAPAYVLTDGQGTPNSRDGDGEDIAIVPELKFDEKTCPMCFLQGGADEYSPLGSTRLYRKIRQMGVAAELHLFADRPHGFHGNMAKGEEGEAFDHWFFRVAEFIRQMNYDGRLGGEINLMSRFASDEARGFYEKEDIWPSGQTPPGFTNQCSPFIEWHFPKERKTAAVQIIFSGGGYHWNKPEGMEVTPARRYFNAKGMTVVTLKYREPRPAGGLAKHISAWQDLQRAVRIVRSKAAAKGLDPEQIGIMGGSAGGHLALMGATSSRRRTYLPIDDIDRLPCKVQWAVALYPAYALTDGVDGVNTNGGNTDDDRLVSDFSFDLDTCPVLFIHGDSDGYSAMASVKAWEQLRRMGVQGEVHTLATRPHCFQTSAAPGTGSYTYLDRIWEFMNHRKVVR
ncbi:MAG: alpha/beta hydrolase fold domain-containing protein [Kiritimatiellae bacterium]|nr:alpha/beta hydrolase fold domain-containing protein [Kiritimatiellia bacterium]